MALQHFYSDSSSFEIGVDEAGRGPMFGRVYVSAVVLPKEDNCDFSSIKDSKKFTSKKKIKEVAEFIKQKAIAWSVQYAENDTIDKINIREAVLSTMNRCVDDILQKMGSTLHKTRDGILILVDGNDFRPYMVCDEETMELSEINHVTVEQGDSKYYSIAAASILAKVARDEYILDLCEQYPILVENYGLNTNMGYGTKKHMEGIVKHGITQWHRRSYGICKVGEPRSKAGLAPLSPCVPLRPPPLLDDKQYIL